MVGISGRRNERLSESVTPSPLWTRTHRNQKSSLLDVTEQQILLSLSRVERFIAEHSLVNLSLSAQRREQGALVTPDTARKKRRVRLSRRLLSLRFARGRGVENGMRERERDETSSLLVVLCFIESRKQKNTSGENRGVGMSESSFSSDEQH